LFIRNVTEPSAAGLDLPSVRVSARAVGGLVYGFSGLGQNTEASPLIPPGAAIAVGAVARMNFVWRQLLLQRHDRDLRDLRGFRSTHFCISIGLVLISFLALFGTLILLPVYMQYVLGHDPLVTGLTMLPGGLAMGLLAPVVGRLYDRIGPRPLVIP